MIQALVRILRPVITKVCHLHLKQRKRPWALGKTIKGQLTGEGKTSKYYQGDNILLRSSHSNARVLRSMSAAKKSPSESVHTPVQPAAKRTTRNRPIKRGPKNEFSKICQQVRYILNRMNYEQSLIEAYTSEGWKRQSLERIRPEKELERAKAEILRCKLAI